MNKDWFTVMFCLLYKCTGNTEVFIDFIDLHNQYNIYPKIINNFFFYSAIICN